MIELLKNLYKIHRNLILYCMIGCVGASLDFCIFSILVYHNLLHVQIVNIISVSTGINVNFFLNYFFNFRSQGKLLLRWLSFYSIGILGLNLSALCLWIFIKHWNISAIIAKLCTIFIVTAVQYTLNKIISFRKG